MLNGKTVVVGVTGGIAAYKACEVVSRLKKSGAEVFVIMTKNAAELVQPITFETLSGNRVAMDTFDTNRTFEVEHIALAKRADLFLIVPATANSIAKFALGIADDMLSTTVLAAKCPKIICPAMNTAMYENAVTQKNLETLVSLGWKSIEPESGRLACGDEGKGKLAAPEVIVEAAVSTLLQKQDLKGKTILITAGGTAEPVDAVRVLTNRSSGKMGYALAERAVARGAEVILVSGPTRLDPPSGAERISVMTTAEMYDAVIGAMQRADYMIMAAAPADYRPQSLQTDKIKEPAPALMLTKNPDIAEAAGKKKKGRKLIIFCAETENLLENAQKKLVKKHADMVVANDVTKEGAGFDVDTNIVSILKQDGTLKEYGKMSKTAVADIILNEMQ